MENQKEDAFQEISNESEVNEPKRTFDSIGDLNDTARITKEYKVPHKPFFPGEFPKPPNRKKTE